jgi:hypothetical protein
VSFIVFPGYVGDAYFLSGFPFVTFFVAIGAALLAVSLAEVTAMPVMAAGLIVAAALLPNSIRVYKSFPPLGGDYIAALEKLGLERVGIDKVFQGLAFAGAGVREVFVDRQTAATADYYLCLNRPWFGVDCDQRRRDFSRIVANGKNFFIAANK